MLTVFFSKEELDRFGKDLEAWRGEHLKRDFLPRFRPFPQVRALFERVLADGKRVALASSAKPDEIETYKEIAGIADLVGKDESTSSGDAEKSKPHPDIFEAAMAKLYTGELTKRVADRALQIHGGYGFMDEYAISRLYRDQKVLEIGEGTNEVQRMVIARYLGL